MVLIQRGLIQSHFGRIGAAIRLSLVRHYKLRGDNGQGINIERGRRVSLRLPGLTVVEDFLPLELGSLNVILGM